MQGQAIAAGGLMGAQARSSRDVEFESWLVAREPALQRTAHLLTGDVHTAQDLVQVTLAKLYLAWDRIQDRGNVDAYARKILVNEHRTAWRRPVRRREQVTDELPDRPAPEQRPRLDVKGAGRLTVNKGFLKYDENGPDKEAPSYEPCGGGEHPRRPS